MSDIVDRLRYTAQIRAQHRSDTDPIKAECLEAAATITALRAEVERLQGEWANNPLTHQLMAHADFQSAEANLLTARVEELKGEIEKLHAARHSTNFICDDCMKARATLSASQPAPMTLHIDEDKFLAAVDRDGDHEVGAGAASQPAPSPWPETIETYYARQIEWSHKTFGPGKRTGGIIDHITKELREVSAEPEDLNEWVDLIILAMDGFWRHGGTAEDLMPRLLAKQKKNMARTWPDWRTMSTDKAIEHDRSADLPPAPQKEGE